MLQNELFFSYVDESDKDILALEKELDIEFAKATMALEYVDRMYEINTMKSDLRVLTENGTYDDINFLYEEAQKEASGSKKGIIATLIEKIQNFLHNLSNMFTKKFGDKAEEQVTDAAKSGALGSIQLPKDPNKVLDAIGTALKNVGNFLKPGFHVTDEAGEKVLSIRKTLVTSLEAIGAVTIAGTQVPKLLSRFNSVKDEAEKLTNNAKAFIGKNPAQGISTTAKNPDRIEGPVAEEEKKLNFVEKCLGVLSDIVKFIGEHFSAIMKTCFGKLTGLGKKNKGAENAPEEKKDTRQYAQPDDNDTVESADDDDDVTVDDTVYESCDEIIDLIDNL